MFLNFSKQIVELKLKSLINKAQNDERGESEMKWI